MSFEKVDDGVRFERPLAHGGAYLQCIDGENRHEKLLEHDGTCPQMVGGGMRPEKLQAHDGRYPEKAGGAMRLEPLEHGGMYLEAFQQGQPERRAEQRQEEPSTATQ